MDHTALITEHIVREYAPDVPASELPADYDLLAGGIIDSLTLLRIIPWIETRFAADLDSVEIGPDDFRTVASINDFIERAVGASRHPLDAVSGN